MVPKEDVPYTLSMDATITSQHGVERVQCNCPLRATEYLADKTSAQVTSKEALLLLAPLFLGPELLPHSVFPKYPYFSRSTCGSPTVLLLHPSFVSRASCPFWALLLTPPTQGRSLSPQPRPQPQAKAVVGLTGRLGLFPCQISLADGHKFDRDVELLIYYREVHAPSVAVEMGEPSTKPGIFLLPL